MENMIINRGLLIGNGLNRCVDVNQKIGWNKVLEEAVEYSNQLGADISVDDMELLDSTFKFEYIANSIEGGPEKYINLKEHISNYIQNNLKTLPDDLVESICKSKYNFIITTNYDNNLERSILGHEYSFSALRNKNSSYSFERTNYDHLYNRYDTSRLFDMYHIHGIVSRPKYICLGFEHYNRIAAKIALEIGKQGVDNNKRIPKILQYLKEKSESSNTSTEEKSNVLTRFFESDLAIVGLELSPAEIDIWYILVYRAYLFFSNINDAKSLITNKITYYETYEKETIVYKMHPNSKRLSSFQKEQIVDVYLEKRKKAFEKMNIVYYPIQVQKTNYKEAYIDIFKQISKE